MAGKRKKRLEIDMIAGSQLRDTQGETLAVEGADISDLEMGRGRLNDNHGKGFFNSIGRVLEAKKIFKEEDCVNDRQRYYWEKIKAPYIYVRGELYDDEDHPNAKAAAAILRNIHKADVPLKIKASVEGGVISRGLRDASLLAQTKIHSVALTFTPANNATLVEPLNLDKSLVDEADDLILIKSVIHLAKNDVPNFRMIQKAASAAKAARNIKQIQHMLKEAKEQEMEKGLKNAIAGAALAGTMAASPVKATSPQPVAQPNAKQAAAKAGVMHTGPVDHKAIVDGIRDIHPHLWAIAQYESSGGKNLEHETLKGGQHKGMTAGGAWGMMPKTVGYVLKLSKKLREKYPELNESVKDIGKNHQSITDALNKNPRIALDLAKALHGHIKNVYGDDFDKVAHAWHHGIQGTANAAKKGQKIGDNEYVKKINSYYSGLPKRNVAGQVAKALTAGYGGAGSPTDMSGGGIFQTESLEDGRAAKFKYVTCDNCGHEQVHAKYQVKCRECKRPFSLQKLYKLTN